MPGNSPTLADGSVSIYRDNAYDCHAFWFVSFFISEIAGGIVGTSLIQFLNRNRGSDLPVRLVAHKVHVLIAHAEQTFDSA